jgi:hypothetical protein
MLASCCCGIRSVACGADKLRRTRRGTQRARRPAGTRPACHRHGSGRVGQDAPGGRGSPPGGPEPGWRCRLRRSRVRAVRSRPGSRPSHRCRLRAGRCAARRICAIYPRPVGGGALGQLRARARRGRWRRGRHPGGVSGSSHFGDQPGAPGHCWRAAVRAWSLVGVRPRWCGR